MYLLTSTVSAVSYTHLYDQPEERRLRGFLFKNMTDAFSASRELLQKFKPSVMRLYNEAETATLIKKIVGVEKPGAFMNIAIEGVSELVEVDVYKRQSLNRGTLRQNVKNLSPYTS